MHAEVSADSKFAHPVCCRALHDRVR
jgi:hypothetical protein